MTSKRKLLDLINKAEELGLPIPADVLLEMSKQDIKAALDALKIKLKLKPSDLPIYTLTQPGAVPAPGKKDLVLTSEGWDEQLTRLIYAGLSSGGITGHAAHIADADGTIESVTSKFNTLLAELESIGVLNTK